MPAKEITVTIRPRWWLGYYLSGIEFISSITGLDPDPEKLAFWVSKGIKIDGPKGSGGFWK